MDDSWTDSNLNRVSVIQFQEETKPEEEDDEAAAERRVRKRFVPFMSFFSYIFHVLLSYLSAQMLHTLLSFVSATF